MRSTVPCTEEFLPFEPEDVALLARLRALAWLFQVVGDGVAHLPEIEICLWVDPTGQMHPLGLDTTPAAHLLARAAGWSDLAAETAAGRRSPSLFDVIHARLAAAEFPSGPPRAIHRLLTQIRGYAAIPAAIAAQLAQLGWQIYPPGGLIFPIFPPLSAHEALEAVVAVEDADGLGPGPLGRLARAVVAAMWGGGR